ncbi:MAG: tetratricopeptide repeat protein [Bacteroidales bacterium]|nr:tetratricopeptide repeat protein [Bacteroidales bacterium]
MIGDDFLNINEEEEFSNLISECEEAFENGTLENLKFTEEEFEFLINHFIDEVDDDIVYVMTKMAYNQHPYSTDLIIRYADVLIVNRELERAMDILNNQMDLDSGNSDIHFLLGRIYIKLGDDQKATEYVQRALSLTVNEKTEMLLTASQDYIDMGKFDFAISLLEGALKNSPDNLEIINDLAFCYERKDNLQKSLEFYEKYLDNDPFNDNVWFNIGTIYARDLNINKAVEAFDYAIALNPYNSSVLYNKAILLINTGRYDEGIEVFTEFLKMEPDNIFALIGIADAYLGKDRLDDAMKFFMMALVTSDESIDANTGVAYIHLLKQEEQPALPYLRKVIGLEGADYLFLLAELLKTYKRTKEPEFLVYYLTALYHTQESELFLVYLELLVAYGEVWLARLFELIPSLKKDDKVTGQIAKSRKK